MPKSKKIKKQVYKQKWCNTAPIACTCITTCKIKK